MPEWLHPYCDDRLWIEGKERRARELVESIPADRRAFWDCILFVASEQEQVDQYGNPRRDGVVLVCLKDGHRVTQWWDEDYFLCGASGRLIALIEQIMREAYEEQVRD